MAYAAMASLKQTVDRLLPYFESNNLLHNSEKEYTSDDLSYFLQSRLQTIRDLPTSQRLDAAFETRLKDAVNKFEDLIYSLFLSGYETSMDESLTLAFSKQLLEVMEEIDSFTTNLKTEYNREDQLRRSDSFPSYIVPSITEKKKMVGLDKQIKQLKSWVLSNESELSYLSVVGMAGIGKTTLVKQVYYDPGVMEKFECHLYLPIGPQCHLTEVMLLVLHQLNLHDPKMHKNVDERSLRDLVYQSLVNKRYLIVFDDIWDHEISVELQYHILPDDNNGSCLIFTTQSLNLAHYTYGKVLEMPLLSDDESWKLLQQVVFTTEERCEPELEKVGKKIAKKCEGLPLAIIEVGKLLQIEKTVEKWKTVAESEDPLNITIDDDTPLAKALSLSYRMLPQYLKVCFLYMGVFPKKYKIRRSKIIKLLIYEGFIQVDYRGYTLEETASECLDELVSRSVVLCNKVRSIHVWKTKTCRFHFTFRSLCVNEAKGEKFFHVIKKYTDCFPEKLNRQQRLCIHNNVVLAFKQVHSWMESVSDARSLLCFGPWQQYPIVLYLRFKLLKVLDALLIRFYEFPSEVLELIHIRYLAITYDGELPDSISCLWNLEVLIVHHHHNIKSSNDPVYLPVEIWNLHELNHLECMGFDLPEPPADDSGPILGKLLTVLGVTAHSCTRKVLSGMPNLTRIGIRIESTHDTVKTFSFLGEFTSIYEEFESFKCVVINPNLGSGVVSSIPNFPVNIKKISLSGCGFPWESMRVIATLPNLVVLKLRWYAFCGPDWVMHTMRFPQLEYLLLEDLDIQHWEADHVHFPLLARLVIRHCYKLREIPSEIGCVEGFEIIEVDDCNPYLAVSAEKVEERRRSKFYQGRIYSSWDHN